MGSIAMSSQPVRGITVDEGTALTITEDGDCTVCGSKYVYFASTDPTTFSVEVVNPEPGIHQINVNCIDLRQWSSGETFKLAEGWNFSSTTTDFVSVTGGDVLWAGSERFF